VAYVVSHDKPEPTVSEVRQFLQGKLPDYMIPSLFLFLDALPLTSNGKLDRNALPPPDGERRALEEDFVEPRTEIEELIAQVWREVLKREKIEIHDNFFDLGGHSLLATRVVARLRSHFHVDLPLRKLFELPTVAALAQHIDALRRSGEGTVITPIVPVPRNGPLTLLSSQRRLWYLHKVDPNLSAYNIPACFHIKGYLDTGALEKSLNAMIARHEVFRSAIVERNGEPCLEIGPTLEFPLPVVDLSHLPAAHAEAEAKRKAGEDARRMHALNNPPLFRARLVKLSEDEHFLILNFHHIIADGSSLGIFYRELAALYEAACANKLPLLPKLPVQYADYAAWQHQWLNSNAFVIQLDYWKRRLSGLAPPIEIPTDFDRSARQSNRGARAVRRLSEELTASVKQFSRQNGPTVFMTLFATFNVLLARATGRDDILIGSTIAGRNRPETDGLIGFFINALPLRTDLSGDPSFTTLLQRVRDACLDAYTHQEMPFEKIIEELKPPREPGRNPLFDVIFNVADMSERTLTLSGCEIVKISEAYPAPKFDIVLHAPEVDGKIELAIVYNTDLFLESRITLLLDQFAFLLEQAINHPGRAISQYSLVAETSRPILPDPAEPLDASWNGAIHEHLAEQARRSPDKPAVVDPDQSWTYGELDQTANRLTQALISSGIRPGDIVAIYAQRRAALTMTLFGILKAGASFLILDPAYPPARTINYLRIAGAKGWIGLEDPTEEIMSYLENLDLRCRLTIPRARAEILQVLARYTDVEPGVSIGPASPAYVAFTSGSSGEPKGVLCSHGPITHFLPWQKENFELSGSDRFAMLSGLAYSHLHRDVFTAVYLGATIYIPSPSQARSPDQLANWVKQNAITVLHLTPALGQLLLTGTETRLPLVRRVFFGGDVLTTDEVAQIRQLAPNAIIGSFYGTTETQRAVGYHEIGEDALLNNRSTHKTVPLGQGITDVQLLVLNKSGQLAGIGELGELFVRSPHLAAGYIGDNERTRQMFVINPFTNDPADRLYRTGELGRYLPDGNVEWSGRNDRRVNIRGFRVELAEVESTLKQHPTVKDAAVIVQEVELPSSETSGNRKSKIENPKSDLRLVAYVISTEEDSQSLRDLLYAYISSRLPDYMIPAHFVILSSLPLSPNGKVDYRPLPPVRFSAGSAATAPRNDIAVKLQAIFAEVLGRADIEIHDNFFRVGGHSLLAARAAARIGDAFGVSLALSTFLEAPTVMGLATRVASVISSGQTDTESDKDDEREEFDL
jgi:amino acid adenylation domain-containing protein